MRDMKLTKIESGLNYKEGNLYFSGLCLSDFLENVDSPVFVVSESMIHENYHALKAGMSDAGIKSQIRYCAKTNNEAFILRTMASLDSHVLVSHLAEAQLAIKCGFLPAYIAYQRPVFIEDEVRSILELGISIIHIYHLEDISRISSMAKVIGIQVQISLRLRNSNLNSIFHPVHFPARRLGLSENELIAAAISINKNNNLRLRGINFYIGTQKSNPEKFKKMIRKVLSITDKLKEYGIQLKEINIGGGIPSISLGKMSLKNILSNRKPANKLHQSTRNLRTFGEQLARVYKNEGGTFEESNLPEFVLEPGRSIVGISTILISKVKMIKGNWVFLDASKNYLGESSFLFRRLILPLVRNKNKMMRNYHLSGSTLNTQDVLGYFFYMPKLVEGDYLVFDDAGAYSISRANRYAGLSPSIYVIKMDGNVEIIRYQEGVDDLISAMVT